MYHKQRTHSRKYVSFTVHFCVPYCPLLCPLLSTFVSLTVHFCVPYPPETLTLPRARAPPNKYLTVLLTVLLTVYLIKRVRARDKKTEKLEALVLSKITSH